MNEIILDANDVKIEVERIIKIINEDHDYLYNLNDDEEEFNIIMDSLCPATEIEMNWSCEISDSGRFNVNLQIKDRDIKEIMLDQDLVSRLEQVFEGKIHAFYYQYCQCPVCNYKNLEEESANQREFYKNNTNYHTDCGYPRGVLDYIQIAKREEKETNTIAFEDLPDELKKGKIYEKLKELYK